MWARILNFPRLPIAIGGQLLFYYLLRVLGFPSQERFFFYSQYYEHLIENSGTTVRIDKDSYLSKYEILSGLRKLFVRRQPSSDLLVFKQIFADLEYEPLVDLIGRSGSSRNLRIIDAGANVGYSTLWFYWQFPNASILSVEPDSTNYEFLIRNLSANAASEVVPVLGGIWHRDAYLSIERDFRDRREWSIRVVESHEVTSLHGYSVLQLINNQGWDEIDILKIDIEGSEKQLFSEPAAARAFLRKTRLIAIEIHDEFECREVIIDTLQECNFELSQIGETLFGRNLDLCESSRIEATSTKSIGHLGDER